MNYSYVLFEINIKVFNANFRYKYPFEWFKIAKVSFIIQSTVLGQNKHIFINFNDRKAIVNN